MLRPEEKLALGRLDAPVLAVGDDGRIAHLGPGALRALGWDARLVGHPVRDIIPAARLPRHREDYGLLALGQWPIDGIPSQRAFVGPDGKERLLHSQVVAFRRPDGSRFLCATITDEAKRASLDGLTVALESVGYKRLTPAVL